MTDTRELLTAWGQWANDNYDGLDCKSPSLMMLALAPHADSSDRVKSSRERAYISDEDALRADSAIGDLQRHSALLCAILRLHYQYGWSVRKIARDYLTKLEYPDSNKQVSHPAAGLLLERAVGIVEGRLIDL